MNCVLLFYRVCFLPWHKTHQKSFNIAKELGSAVPEKFLNV